MSTKPAVDPPSALPPPENVVEALSRVMADLGPIGKKSSEEHGRGRSRGGEGEGGLNYPYRSIEQITSEASPLFATYGIVFVPHVATPEPPDAGTTALLVEIVRNSTPQVADLAMQFLMKHLSGGQALEREFTLGSRGTRWTDTYLAVGYTIYGPGGAEDYIEAGPFLTVGRDNSDKGFNKAMTQAYKQCLLQVLCVADPQDEGEHERHLDEGRTTNASPPPSAPVDQTPRWQKLGYEDEDELQALNDSLKEMMTRLADSQVEGFGQVMDVLGYPKGARLPVAKEHLEAVRDALKAALAAGEDSAESGGQGTLADQGTPE